MSTKPLSELTRLHAELQEGKKVQPYMNSSDPLVVEFARAADKELPALLERLAKAERIARDEEAAADAQEAEMRAAYDRLETSSANLIAQLRTSLAAAEGERGKLRTALTGNVEHGNKLAAELVEALAERDQLRSDLKSSQHVIDLYKTSLADSEAERKQLKAYLTAAAERIAFQVTKPNFDTGVTDLQVVYGDKVVAVIEWINGPPWLKVERRAAQLELLTQKAGKLQ